MPVDYGNLIFGDLI